MHKHDVCSVTQLGNKDVFLELITSSSFQTSTNIVTVLIFLCRYGVLIVSCMECHFLFDFQKHILLSSKPNAVK